MFVIAAQGGNPEAFGHIVTRFQDMAYALLGDSCLAQDAAIKIIKEPV